MSSNDASTRSADKPQVSSSQSSSSFGVTTAAPLISADAFISAMTLDRVASERDAARAKVAELERSLEIAAHVAEIETENRILGFGPLDIAKGAAPWEMFAAAIRQQIQGAEQWQGLQIVGAPLSANWHDPKYGAYRAFRVVGDSKPVWGSTYGNSGLQISRGYYLFITNLDIPLTDPKEKAKAEDARKRYVAALDDLERVQVDVGPHWQRFDERQKPLPEIRRLTFDQWYQSFDGRKVAALLNSVQLASQDFTSFIVKAYKGYAFAANLLSDYDNPAFQQFATSDTDDLRLAYRTYRISPDLATWISESLKTANSGAPSALSFELTRTSDRYDYSKSVWGGSASWFGFFGARASGSRIDIDTTHDAFRMKFECTAIETFTVNPGQWMNPEAIQVLQNGPFVSEGPLARGAVKLFGPDGVLNLLPTQLVVAFRPKVSATVTREEYHYAKSEFFASGGLSIGPFGFGASFGRTNVSVQFDSDTNTVTMQDVSDVPHVIAVVSRILPDFK